MSRILTNNINLAYSVEASLGVLEGSPVWADVEPNGIGSYGADISTVARNPISKNRQRQKGTITNIESAVEFDSDLTLSALQDFVEGFAFSSFQGNSSIAATAVTATGFTVASGATAFAPDGALIRVTGAVDPASNGLFQTGTNAIDTEIVVAGLGATETTGIAIEVVGFRTATGDLDVTVSGSTTTLTSTVLDFTTLPILAGQAVYIGGFNTANQFGTTAVPISSGLARVVSIAANAMVVDKEALTFTTEANTTKDVDLFFGKFVRNVPTDHAHFLERSYQFELELPGLDSGGATMYEYAVGNLANEISLELPITDKASLSVGFVGQDANPPVAAGSRATNAESATSPSQTTAFNTSADIARLRVDQVDGTGLTTDFKSLSLTINNNASPENVLGTTGAKFINAGNLEIGFEAELLFTESGVADAIRNNTTVSMDFRMSNDNGTAIFDIPSLTLGGGGKSYPVNETVTISTTGEAFADTTLNSSIGITVFNHALPIDPANPTL